MVSAGDDPDAPQAPQRRARSEAQPSEVQQASGARSEAQPSEVKRTAPPLRPFGLVLHHDGSWSHEGQPIRHVRLRAAFDRAVRYLPDERKYVVQLGRFRGEIALEEAAFFVRSVDLARGRVTLSDGSSEALDPATLRPSPIDSALLCRVHRGGAAERLLARFDHAAQAELLLAVEATPAGPRLRLGGALHELPDAVG